MKYTTYVCGKIDISGLPKVNKMQIRSYLEEIYPVTRINEVYSEEEVTIDDEWEDFETSEKFLVNMFKISRQIDKDTNAIIMCNGEREGDIWAIILKSNRIFTQRFELKPEGEMEEYEKVRF
jgi:hypothetical protein